MKKLTKFLVVLMAVFFSTGCGESAEKKMCGDVSYYESSNKTNSVVINLEDGRTILIDLYPDIAPKTVDNFKKLVKEKFYNGVTFHRVINNFMIQTGDASSLGRSADSIKGEFSENGFENNLSHERGVVSMARTNDPNSASSQFFIMHKDTKSLDGKYASFGTVIAGMDVVDSIASVVTDNNDKPLTDITIKNIKFVRVVR